MTSLRRAHIQRSCLAALAVLGIVAAFALHPQRALAAPASAVATFSVEASATSVRTTAPIGYTVTVRMRRATPSLRVRLRIYTSGGWLLYQKTEYVSVGKPGTVRVSLSRPDTEAEIEPGIYRAEISVLSSEMTEPLVKEIPLRVYPADKTRLPIVICTRITGPPMTDPRGRFVVDPELPNEALSAATSAADLVLGDARVRLSVALSPVLLAEWQQVADGYQLLTESGVRTVPASGTAPPRYADGLNRLRAAAATGRLEVLSLGYADPNVSWLAREGLLSDIGPQYLLGARTTSSTLEASAVAGTAVAGSCVPPSAMQSLTDAGVRWVVVDQGCALLGKKAPPSGAYRTKLSRLRAVVADSVATKAVRSGEPTAAMAAAFERFMTDDPTGGEAANATAPAHDTPFVINVTAGPGYTDMRVVSELVEEITRSPWAKFATSRQALDDIDRRKVSLRDVAAPDRAPAGYWAEVAKADEAALALSAALAPTAPDAERAKLHALTAESSGWAGADRSWAFADRGRAFSAAAIRRGEIILGRLRLSAPDVTLAGSAGEVPVTITNPTRRVLRVVFLAIDQERVVRSGGRRELLLRPGDTYLTVKVDLRNSLSTSIKLAVRAGGTDIDTDTVVVRASYLDRLAIIGGVLLLLGGLLVFIVLRVRAADNPRRGFTEPPSSPEEPDAVQPDAPRYTDDGSGEAEPEVSDTP